MLYKIMNVRLNFKNQSIGDVIFLLFKKSLFKYFKIFIKYICILSFGTWGLPWNR